VGRASTAARTAAASHKQARPLQEEGEAVKCMELEFGVLATLLLQDTIPQAKAPQLAAPAPQDSGPQGQPAGSPASGTAGHGPSHVPLPVWLVKTAHKVVPKLSGKPGEPAAAAASKLQAASKLPSQAQQQGAAAIGPANAAAVSAAAAFSMPLAALQPQFQRQPSIANLGALPVSGLHLQQQAGTVSRAAAAAAAGMHPQPGATTSASCLSLMSELQPQFNWHRWQQLQQLQQQHLQQQQQQQLSLAWLAAAAAGMSCGPPTGPQPGAVPGSHQLWLHQQQHIAVPASNLLSVVVPGIGLQGFCYSLMGHPLPGQASSC
jgi:hypothetical protein